MRGDHGSARVVTYNVRMVWTRLLPRHVRLTFALAIFQTLAASAVVPGEVHRICWKSFSPDPKTGIADDVCMILAIQRNRVTYIEPGYRALVIGKYASAGQRFVPRTEAPIRDLHSAGSWHIVVSSFLEPEDEEARVGLRVRFFGPEGKLRTTEEVLMGLEDIILGHLFGGSDDIFVIQSTEEHSYNSMTNMWLLPEQGAPQALVAENAAYGKFSKGGNGTKPGAWIARQTYDGIHAETKGWVEEFWVWDPTKKTLTLEKK